MKKRLIALCMVLCLLLGMLAACGSSDSDTEEETTETTEAETTEETEEAEEEAEAEEAAEEETAEETEEAAEEEAAEETEAAAEEEAAEEETVSYDFTESNASFDYTDYKEMLKTLTTELPITTEDVTLNIFIGFESSTLNYIEGGTLDDQQVWQYLEAVTGIDLDLTVIDKTNETEQFNLIIASGDYPDIMPANDYTTGIEAAVEDEVYLDLTDLLEENMPNYWTIINSDAALLEDVQDGGMFAAIYSIKDQAANPSGMGTFIRMDWLEELGMDVPETYDELTEVLRAFKTEMGATEPMSLFNTVSLTNGLLSGGFGSMAELSADAASNGLNGYYQVDGTVVYGATADGTRKYLSWLNELYNEDLINFDNMIERETNPFSDLNATEAADGSTGYIFSNQPFGGNYSTMAASQYGDEDCNWWPVQDVAEEAGQTIPFYEEVILTDSTTLAISTQCENVEVALQFLDYGYSYEGSLLYNFGFEIGSDSEYAQYETWFWNDEGEPEFDSAALLEAADTTNIASSVVSTKDLAGVVFDTRLSFEFEERELSCMEAWSTNKTTDNILGSDVSFTAEEGTEAAAIYSDIITYVATSALQFINGALDVNDDAVWDAYVANIESMNLAGLTELVQTAYDRVN